MATLKQCGSWSSTAPPRRELGLRYFQFYTLPDGYDETADLITTLQAKFTNTSGNEITRESDGTATFTHAGQTDTATTVTITHDTNSYKNTLVFDSGSQHKAIALLVEDQNAHTIWESLGFKKEQILKASEISGMRDRLNALASGAGADVIANDVLIGGLKFIRGGKHGVFRRPQDPRISSRGDPRKP